jgi:hypothetical protein
MTAATIEFNANRLCQGTTFSPLALDFRAKKPQIFRAPSSRFFSGAKVGDHEGGRVRSFILQGSARALIPDL